MQTILKISFSFFLIINTLTLSSQNGKIVKQIPVDILANKKLAKRITTANGNFSPKTAYLNDVSMSEITYMSDGLKVKGYLVEPKAEGKYPCVIYNRGGNKEFGRLNEYKLAFILAKVASWGYVVVASQYRGNDGGEGKEEFGGSDVNDILNLIPLLAQNEKSDTSRMGLYGWSRGGMMTYLSLCRTDKFKAAIIGGGLSDLRMMMDTRQDTFEVVYELNIPNYTATKEAALDARSAINQVNKITKTTPILMMHGTADWRVVPQMALELSTAFIENKIPHRLVIFEGGNHALSEHRKEVEELTKMWLDKYVKNNSELPNLRPHGK